MQVQVQLGSYWDEIGGVAVAGPEEESVNWAIRSNARMWLPRSARAAADQSSLAHRIRDAFAP